MQALAKAIIVNILGWQVRRLQSKTAVKVVAVAGSVGKTSTKMAITKILSQKYAVLYQDGNYNDIVSVPLIFFGQNMPSLFNPIGWLKVILVNEIELIKKYPYDIVVIELGVDGPGQLKKFSKYLRIEIGVLTAITPEHMEYFEDLDAVAEEEMYIFKLSSLMLVNKDMCPAKYLDKAQCLSYAIEHEADYKLTNLKFDDSGSSFDVYAGTTKIFSGQHEAIAEPLLYAILAGVAVGKKLDLDDQQIDKGIKEIKPATGRMQTLAGINGSTIIDDTYNASPEAVEAALTTLYRLSAPQKIVILGNMNELGTYSEGAHRQIGKLCDPKKLDLLVTIGPDANQFLAEAAERNGCQVERFNDPYSAGEFIKPKLKAGALILAKGSQNGVFAEETVKLLLANPEDKTKLVRQSKYWMKQKNIPFKQ